MYMKLIEFKPSTRKNKKYDAFHKGEYITSFGDKRYQHYFDKLGYYSYLNHYDEKRRANYYKRHNKDYEKYSADWFSKKFLW